MISASRGGSRSEPFYRCVSNMRSMHAPHLTQGWDRICRSSEEDVDEEDQMVDLEISLTVVLGRSRSAAKLFFHSRQSALASRARNVLDRHSLIVLHGQKITQRGTSPGGPGVSLS